MDFKKIINWGWSLRFEFVKYFVTGIGAVVLDMVSLIFFKEICGTSATIAVLINQPIVLLYVFFVNKFWSFRDKSMPHRQMIRFFVTAGCNYLISFLIMYIFHDKIGFDYKLVRLTNIALGVSWNFLLYKYWIYRP